MGGGLRKKKRRGRGTADVMCNNIHAPCKCLCAPFRVCVHACISTKGQPAGSHQ